MQALTVHKENGYNRILDCNEALDYTFGYESREEVAELIVEELYCTTEYRKASSFCNKIMKHPQATDSSNPNGG